MVFQTARNLFKRQQTCPLLQRNVSAMVGAVTLQVTDSRRRSSHSYRVMATLAEITIPGGS
jgi:hypothetical protein